MSSQSAVQTVDYYGLLMQHIGGDVLFCADDGAIIDCLSRFDYPREFLTIDSTNTVVFQREPVLDLIIVNNFQKEGEKGLTIGVWLDFVGHQTDLRYLGRPYDEAHQAQYHDIWNNIATQIRAIGQRSQLRTIAFIVHDGDQFRPHFRYVQANHIRVT